MEERVVRFRTQTVVAVLGIVLAVVGLLQLVWLARQVLTWVLIALFLALALNPLVELFQRRGIRRRSIAAGLAFVLALGAIAGLAGIFIPILVGEVSDFSAALPGYIEDVTEGRGPFGFLETEYGIVERVREAVSDLGPGRLLGVSGAALAVTKGVVTAVIAAITIAVLTFFMLLEGPGWIERFYTLVPEGSRARWRAVGRDIYRTVGGYVTGALTIALLAGIFTAVLLSILSVPYAIALALLVALLDLVPLAGATIATVLVGTISLLDSVPKGLIVFAAFIVYQQIENHALYPMVYSRTVQLSPLAILIAVLVGASLAGILGALAAIPVAGTIQVLLREWLRARTERATVATDTAAAAPPL